MPLSECYLLRQCLGVGATLLLGLMAPCLPAMAENPPQICWAATSFLQKPGDDRIRKGVPQAFVAPPRGTPVQSSPIPRDYRGTIRRVDLPSGVKLVALTFDLCEQPYEIAGYQGDVVDYLRKEKVKATFFAGGKWMLTHRDRTQQLMSDPLFEVANHTWEHRNLRLLNGSELSDEVRRAQLAYEHVRRDLQARQCVRPGDSGTFAYEHAPKRLSLFRFPFGACNAESLNVVGELGLLAIQWDVSSGDPSFGQTADRMTRAVLREVRPGSIVLFHANGRGWHTGSALPGIVSSLRAQGYEFVTVSELINAGDPVYSHSGCYDSRPGDTDRYDALARRLEYMYERAKEDAVLAKPTTGGGIDQPSRPGSLIPPLGFQEPGPPSQK
jgi:peptidoglycan-N-acetylglucosamine deacetylase